ncbi:unnamed protein product, partial [marine sediment metagenome]
ALKPTNHSTKPTPLIILFDFNIDYLAVLKLAYN